MTAPLLELRGITRRFGGVPAVQDVNLSLRSGRVLALLGENGAGKSTLMKIISGAQRADSGQILMDGTPVGLRTPQEARALGISIIHQEFSLVPRLSVRENLFLGREKRTRFGTCDRRAMAADTRAVLARLGTDISPDAPVERLSVAEQQFVEIAKALLRQTRLLILDEPTATLTPTEAGRLFRIMGELKQGGVALVFISHHLEETMAIADDIACLRDGRLVGERAAGDCTPEELIRLMVGRDLNAAFPPRPMATATGATTPLLDVRRLQLDEDRPAHSFQVRAGEILGLAGLVGSGRTGLVRALVGADPALRRELWLDGRPATVRTPVDARAAGIGLVPEDRQREGLVMSASLLDNVLVTDLRKVSHPRWRFLRHAHARLAARRLLDGLRVKCRSLVQPAGQLSGGNQQKLVLAKWLHAGCRVLVLDEPTRGIDVGARAEIYQLMRDLAARGTALIMVSSDLPEILGLSDRVLVMRAGRIVHTFDRGETPSAEAIMHHATGASHV
jgi:ribose transport system ATP-binding protein